MPIIRPNQNALFKTADYKSNRKPQNASHSCSTYIESQQRAQTADHRLPVTDYRLPITGSRSESANYRPPITDYRLPYRTRVRYAFTLTELLVVIGIMGMLLYITMPSFTKMVKGSGVAFSATTMMSRLGLARGTAISKNRYVALLMPGYKYNTNSGDDNKCYSSYPDPSKKPPLPDKYLYSATRMCFVTRTGTSSDYTYTFLSWVPNDSWEFLPAGTVIFRANSESEYNGTDDTDGKGLYDGDTSKCSIVQDVNCSDIGSSYANMKNMRAIIFKPTGQSTYNGSLYVKIGEGAYADSTAGAPTITNKQNYRNIEVDQFIGRINVIN